MNYFDVQKDAALLNSYWDLGSDEGQEEGSELINLMRQVDGQQHADRVIKLALVIRSRG